MSNMNRWEFFESGLGLMAAKLGVIPIDLLTKYDSYKTYKELLAEGNDQASAKLMASDKCRCHYTTIIRAIYWFERDDPANAPIRTRSLRRGQLQTGAKVHGI